MLAVVAGNSQLVGKGDPLSQGKLVDGVQVAVIGGVQFQERFHRLPLSCLRLPYPCSISSYSSNATPYQQDSQNNSQIGEKPQESAAKYFCQTFSNAKLTPPFALTHNARLTNCTIDGEDSPGNQIQVDGDGVTFDGCKFLRCPGSAIRLHGKASNCRIVNCTFEGSQALNTQDKWTGTGIVFANNVIRIPAGVEGLLIDQPGSNPKYSGVVIQGNVFECSEGAKRCIGLARCVGVVVSGNTFRGAKGVEDLLHFEDRASKLLVTGNLFDLAGASHGIDGSNGGDEAYEQKDRVPRNCVFTNNSLWCQQGIGFHLQGTEALGPFVRMTIANNTIHDHSVGIDAFLKDSTVSGNTYYGKGAKERLR